MTTPRTIDNYGGVFVDKLPVEDPTAEVSSAYYNRNTEDTAQMTRTSSKVKIRFPTVTTNGTVQPSAGASHMGVASANLPSIQRTSSGRYDITYPTQFTDALGMLEPIGFTFARGDVSSLSVVGKVQVTIAGPVLNVAVFDTSNALSDLGGNVTIQVEAG